MAAAEGPQLSADYAGQHLSKRSVDQEQRDRDAGEIEADLRDRFSPDEVAAANEWAASLDNGSGAHHAA
jgi:hypothetical protein